MIHCILLVPIALTHMALVSVARAQPGRIMTGLSIGAIAGAEPLDTLSSVDPLSVRGHLDLGLLRRVSVRGEAGWLPGAEVLTAGAGFQLDLLDTTWWRLGLTGFPELAISTSGQQPPGWTFVAAPVGVLGRTGLRVDWLMFWGLSLSGRFDRIWTPPAGTAGPGGWWDGGVGLSVRL